MSTFPNFPKLLQGGIVLLDANRGAVWRVIARQYNPGKLQPQGAGPKVATNPMTIEATFSRP